MAANAKAAAAAAGPRKKAVTPARVARCFVKQYYGLLRTKPNDLFRFYKTDSHFTHGSGTEPVDVVVGKAAIANKIAELDFSSVVVDLENGGSVDYHASQDGGVLVVVLGHMSIAGSPMRPFTQTFFLAPQASGFYVRNDAFRFFSTQLLGSAGGDDMELTPESSAVAASPEIDARAGEEAAAAQAAAAAAAAAEAQAAAAAAEERAAAKAAEEAAAREAAKQEAAAAEKAKADAAAAAAAAAKAPAAPQASAAAAAPNVPAGNNSGNGRPKRDNGRRAAPAKKGDGSKPAPKPAARPSSYLAAVRSKAAAAAAPKPQKRRAPQGGRAATASAASAAAGTSAPGARRSGGNNGANNGGNNNGGNSGSSQPRSSAKGIFCRVQNSVTEAQVREVFGKFGTIASLQITSRGFFKLEYTNASAAAACLKAGSITLNGAVVQPDKLQNTRSRGGRGGDGRRGGSSGSGGGRNGGGRGSRGSRRDTRNRGRRAPPASDRRNGGGNSGGGGGDRRRRAAPAGAQ